MDPIPWGGGGGGGAPCGDTRGDAPARAREGGESVSGCERGRTCEIQRSVFEKEFTTSYFGIILTSPCLKRVVA